MAMTVNPAGLNGPLVASLLAATISLSSLQADPVPLGFLKVGDDVGGYEITSEQRIKAPISSIKARVKVIFYFPAFDTESPAKLKAVRTIMDIYGSTDVAYLVIWENKIPIQELRIDHLDPGNNYSIESGSLPSNPKPSQCYFAQDNKISVNGFYSYGDMVEKLNTLFDPGKIKNKVVESLVRLSDEDKIQRNPAREDLFFFYSPGCERCDHELGLLRAKLALLRATYNVMAVRPDQSPGDQFTDDPFKDSAITDYSRVCFRAFQHLRDPFFIIVRGRRQLQAEMETVAGVLQTIKSR